MSKPQENPLIAPKPSIRDQLVLRKQSLQMGVDKLKEDLAATTGAIQQCDHTIKLLDEAAAKEINHAQ